mgnify:CR=1 FL=1
MNRPPERPIGERPGALLATRLSVLAAEVCDPDRFRRGRVYAKQRAVISVEVRPGEVVGLVQGSRSQPYSVTLRIRKGAAAGGALIPARGDLMAYCTCPDGVAVCKHAVAVLLEFADDVGRTPDLLARWRNVDPASVDDAADDSDPSPVPEIAPAPDPLDAFFGVRSSAERREPATVGMAPLERPSRTLSQNEAERVALEALDSAIAALESLYG